MIKLLVQDLIGQVLDHGIKVARILLVVIIKGQLGGYKQGIIDAIKKMVHPYARIAGSIIILLDKGQHGLVISLVVLNISHKK